MSIYGGFGTRQQETTYNKAVYNLLYLMQLKISRNNKSLPFDEHRFQSLFSKLYNRLFVMEEFKYLPPKYSYSMKDLATDFGVFERMDVSSVISGSTNMSMTTASGFNVNFNKDETSSLHLFKEKDFTSFPLSPIKEQRGPSLQSLKSNSQTLKKYGSISSTSGHKSQSNGPPLSRFRNPQQIILFNQQVEKTNNFRSKISN